MRAETTEQKKKLPYEFTGEEKTLAWDTVVKRIRCIVDNHPHAKKGELGGWIESEENLQGWAWVADDAIVCDDAKVSDRAEISGHAMVFGEAQISGGVQVYGRVGISGDVRLSGRGYIRHIPTVLEWETNGIEKKNKKHES